MTMTPKQERNGVPGPGDGHNTAVPGPEAAPPLAQATAAGHASNAQGLPVWNGAGLEGTAQTEWDAGLAVNDVEGGGSS